MTGYHSSTKECNHVHQVACEQQHTQAAKVCVTYVHRGNTDGEQRWSYSDANQVLGAACGARQCNAAPAWPAMFVMHQSQDKCISHSTNASVTAQLHQSQHKRISYSTNAMQVACNTGAAASVTMAGMLTNALAVHLQHGKQAVGPCVSHSTTAAQLDATMTDLCLLQALDVDGCCGSPAVAWQASSRHCVSQQYCSANDLQH